MARRLQVPIATAHQISDKLVSSRANKRPMKSDGYSTGGISQDADVIIGLYRSDMHPEAHGTTDPMRPNVMELIILKDRLGGTTDAGRSVPLVFADTGELHDYYRG